MLVDLDTPPPPPIPPKVDDENELNPLFPNPLLKKSSLSNPPNPPKPPKPPKLPPFLPFLFLKKLPKKFSSSSLSKPKSVKKCLKISSALWKLKLVPCFGASKP